MLRYLAVLAVMLACFRGDVLAERDTEFQNLVRNLKRQSLEISHLKDQINELKDENRMLVTVVGQLQSASQTDLAQNDTIEERVALLEIQMVDVQEDITVISQDVSDLDQDVNFLFDDQVIQDERLFSLEEENDQTDSELYQISEEIESLQVTTLALDFRVTVLEENGGGDGNSSISQLEERVETLEGTVVDLETRFIIIENDVEDLGSSSTDHETRLMAAEENIQGLQMTGINHELRISALEENDTIAFHVVLTEYETIPDETVVEFNEIVLNQGNGYDGTTGVFTVPPGGDGLYYFSTYLLIDDGEGGIFDIQLNDDVICTAYGDHNDVGGDVAQATCSAVVSVEEEDEVKVVLRGFNDDTPLYAITAYYYNGFNGFKI